MPEHQVGNLRDVMCSISTDENIRTVEMKPMYGSGDFSTADVRGRHYSMALTARWSYHRVSNAFDTRASGSASCAFRLRAHPAPPESPRLSKNKKRA
eukprot:3514194-Pyramimonas_sp.AAC.1